MMMQRNRATLAVKVDAKKLKMTMAMALWLRMAPLAISKATMSKQMSVMVPSIIIKIIMEMADSAKIIISLAQALNQ